jgi:hypothetical protein
MRAVSADESGISTSNRVEQRAHAIIFTKPDPSVKFFVDGPKFSVDILGCSKTGRHVV